ncbi:ly6/PLAUR domain-containing protein 2-like [Ambystoma mexicanum]|uniref:ly6/PLAUR domain-containing protein 2-like n=1 Tax=Ambystoma mexicanum TaxID=8296 RepID=UPI0037E85D8A
MKLFLGALLAAALLAGTADSLECASCKNVVRLNECNNSTQCKSDEQFCLTKFQYIKGAFNLTMNCAVTCVPRSTPPVFVKCCNKDMCNRPSTPVAKA